MFEFFENFEFCRKYFGVLGVLCTIKLIFWISYSDSVYMTVYGNMVKNICSTFFDICWKEYKNVPEVWTFFVLTILLDFFGILGPKWSPYVAEASLCPPYSQCGAHTAAAWFNSLWFVTLTPRPTASISIKLNNWIIHWIIYIICTYLRTLTPQAELALWGVGAFEAGGKCFSLLASVVTNIMSFAQGLYTSMFFNPLWTSAGTSLGHARCSHSNIFQPDVYNTNAKLI